jgi:hypothetical protein
MEGANSGESSRLKKTTKGRIIRKISEEFLCRLRLITEKIAELGFGGLDFIIFGVIWPSRTLNYFFDQIYYHILNEWVFTTSTADMTAGKPCTTYIVTPQLWGGCCGVKLHSCGTRQFEENH